MITEIEATDYGCLKNVKVKLTPVHAFIGPNDSGKSTLLQAVREVVQFASGSFASGVGFSRRLQQGGALSATTRAGSYSIQYRKDSLWEGWAPHDGGSRSGGTRFVNQYSFLHNGQGAEQDTLAQLNGARRGIGIETVTDNAMSIGASRKWTTGTSATPAARKQWAAWQSRSSRPGSWRFQACERPRR